MSYIYLVTYTYFLDFSITLRRAAINRHSRVNHQIKLIILICFGIERRERGERNSEKKKG